MRSLQRSAWYLLHRLDICAFASRPRTSEDVCTHHHRRLFVVVRVVAARYTLVRAWTFAVLRMIGLYIISSPAHTTALGTSSAVSRLVIRLCWLAAQQPSGALRVAFGNHRLLLSARLSLGASTSWTYESQLSSGEDWPNCTNAGIVPLPTSFADIDEGYGAWQLA